MSAQPTPRRPVSIVCVYNDADVLKTCLSASVERGLTVAPETELIAVDNRERQFATAGAALNHGARQARNDVVVFAHQDVVLHSLPRLEEAAATLMLDDRIGVLGAVGVDRHRRVLGRIRDRVVMIGEPAPTPRAVATVDEVLFMLRREDVLERPLADDPRLGWHAYAVEYCARVRRAGRIAAVVDMLLTHNSLTINLANLDVAHRTVGDWYGELLPLPTTCGTIHAHVDPLRIRSRARRWRGAATWWNESLAAYPLRSAGVVLGDVRRLVDDLATSCGATAVRAVDIRQDDADPTVADGLWRLGRPFSAATLNCNDAVAEIAHHDAGTLLLIGNLRAADVQRLPLAGTTCAVGMSRDTGLWVAIGAGRDVLVALAGGRRSRPFAGLVPGGPRRLSALMTGGR